MHQYTVESKKPLPPGLVWVDPKMFIGSEMYAPLDQVVINYSIIRYLINKKFITNSFYKSLYLLTDKQFFLSFFLLTRNQSKYSQTYIYLKKVKLEIF